MNVVKEGDVYRASRITGPTHNFLGLAITHLVPSSIQCVQRRSAVEATRTVDEPRLVAAVLQGVEAATRDLPVPLFVERIEYVPSDTPVYGAYVELAISIVRAASKDLR